MDRLIKGIRDKIGSQMVEAAISLPVIILAAMLMLRLFTFYLEILTTGISEHREAMEAQDSYRGAFLKTYRDSKEIRMLRGGLLLIDVSKNTETKAYMINEDVLVRSGEIVD
jgi:hypothetical protein